MPQLQEPLGADTDPLPSVNTREGSLFEVGSPLKSGVASLQNGDTALKPPRVSVLEIDKLWPSCR